MNPDELRALADALEPMAKAPRFEDMDVPAFCRWLRAQADAQPVAWRTFDGEGNYDYRAYELNEDYADEWNRRNPNHVGWVEPLYTRPAPAAPQTEPKRDWSTIDAAIREYLDNYELIGEDDSGADACYTPTERELYLIYDAINGLLADENFVTAISTPQAEPKREPLSDEPTGAIYGIIDPDYGRVYTIARKLAWEEGYAIGLHGSFTRDLDMIAVPWTDTACEPEHLIRRIVEATGLKLRDGVGVKPHGRLAWTLLFPAFGDPRFVDLSVMPRIGGSDAE